MTSIAQSFGKFEVHEEIGRGGFAVVYRAIDKQLGREVALKLLNPALLNDPGFIQRFEQEARTAARLRHPHIVTIYEMGEVDGRYFIAMDRIPGPTLREHLQQQGALSWAESREIMTQVAEALDYAHRQGLVHRDLKPSNILLDPDRGAILTDFGLARLLGDDNQLTVSVTGGVMGTPAYIPLEVWDGQKATPAADVYALGCILYEMVTGQVLFPGATPLVTMRQHDRGVQLPETWPPDTPFDLTVLLARSLAKDFRQRQPDAGMFLKELQRLSPTGDIAEPVLPPAQAKNGTAWGIGALLVLLVIGLVGGVILFQRSKNTPVLTPASMALQGDGLPNPPLPSQVTETQTTAVANNSIPGNQTHSPNITVSSDASAISPSGEQVYTYTVQLGDTTNDIACRYGLTIDQLVAYNVHLSDRGRNITEGVDWFNIPTGGELEDGQMCSFGLPDRSQVKMVYVPAGPFIMGSDGVDQQPTHEASTDAFWINRTEVTNKQFTAFVTATGYRTTAEELGTGWKWTTDGWAETEGVNWQTNNNMDDWMDHPVVFVSWDDASAFCAWRHGARLPTEEEWEKAARGTEGITYPWGNSFVSTGLNYCDQNCPLTLNDDNANDKYHHTAPVGRFLDGESPYGALDMAGNVWEWTNPTDGNDTYLRGGSWASAIDDVTTFARLSHDPLRRDDDVGFRCVYDLLP